MSSNQREVWIDSLRGIAFLMVIYYHLSTNEVGGIVSYFTPVFLTSFFFVSGYLTKGDQSFSKVLEQRTRTLFIPLLIYGFGGGIITSLVKGNTITVSFIESLKGVFYQYGNYQTLWFIASLYVYSLVFWIVVHHCNTTNKLLCATLGMIVINEIVLYNLHCPRLPYRIEHIMWAMAIMSVGKLYKEHETSFDKWIMRWVTFIVATIIYFSVIYYSSTRVLYYGNANWFYALSLPATGMILLLFASKKLLYQSRLLVFIGRYSLVYFALHRMVLKMLIEPMFNKAMVQLDVSTSLWTNMAEVAMTAIVLIVPVYIINRYLPQINGKGWKLWNAQ